MILMATLGPKANAVVEAGRSGLRGTDADLERVEAALRARLGPAALPPDAPTPASTHGLGFRLMAPALGVCVIGGALFVALRPAPPSAPQKPATMQVPPAVISAPSAMAPSELPANQPVAEPETPAKAAPAPSPSVRAPSARSAAARPEQDQLLLEVALLSRATTALNNGRIAEALRALDEHQRQFPNGVLSEERRAAKAQALCSSGRVTEGQAQLAHISPRSPAGKRAKQVCDTASAPATKSP